MARALARGGAAGATYELQLKDGQYVLLAHTPKSWAGTRQAFTVVLDIQSVPTAVIQF